MKTLPIRKISLGFLKTKNEQETKSKPYRFGNEIVQFTIKMAENTETIKTFKVIKVGAKSFNFRTATAISDGIMSAEDKIKLDALSAANIAGNNLSEITITGPTIEELKPEFDSINTTLDNHTEKLTTITTKVTGIDNTVNQQSNVINELTRVTSTLHSSNYCGRVWDESNSSPVAKTYCGNLDMLRELPELLGLGCYLVQNDHTRRKLNPTDHYKFADDDSEAKLDGSMGHYQWGWSRSFYITTWNENNIFYECISFTPIRGRKSYYIPVGSMSAAGHAAMDRETNTLVSFINNDEKYRGGNNNQAWDSELENGNIPAVGKNLLGRCVTNKTTSEFAAAARKNGEGWYAGTMRMAAVVKILFEVIMGTRNCQTAFNAQKDINGLYQGGLGNGVCYLYKENGNIWNKYNAYNPCLHMSAGVDKGDILGLSDEFSITCQDMDNKEFTTNFRVPIFFGLKNPYGHIWRVSEDEFGYSTSDSERMDMVHYVRKSMYSEDYVYATKNDAVYECASMVKNNQWVKYMSYDRLECYPTEPGGSSNTYFSDYWYYYNPAVSSPRAVFRAAGSDGGATAGLSYVYVSNAPSHASAVLGSPLCEFTEDFLLEPVITPGS